MTDVSYGVTNWQNARHFFLIRTYFEVLWVCNFFTLTVYTMTSDFWSGKIAIVYYIFLTARLR